MSRLLLLHQPVGTAQPPPGAVLWRTCLRDVVFLADACEARPPVMADGAAYALLVEIVSGLRSPLIGETEVQAQFKAFLDTLDAQAHADLIRLGQRVLTDAKLIRRRHLQGFGARSYSGLALGHIPPDAHVVLVGTGALASEIAAAVGAERAVDQWGRRTPVQATAQSPQFRLFSAARPGLVHSTAPAVLVIAAPASAADLDRVAAGYPGLMRVIDLRPADERSPLAARVPTVTLDDLFSEASIDARVASRPVARARADIETLGRAYANRDELRPFGWDDLCA